MNMDRIEPVVLKPGDTLGVAAPSGPFDAQRFEQGIACLRGLGFDLFIPDGIYQRKGYLAGDDASRAAVLNLLFMEPGVAGIICARGGYGAMRILSMLDFDGIRENPKPFVGFSDVSALHWALFAKSGLRTLHGPNATTLCNATPETVESLFRALTAETPVPVTALEKFTVCPGRAEGKLLGGNLATLCHLVGTPFAPSFEGALLFLEDVGEPHYKIDRMLTQMDIAGAFAGVRGIALGTFEKCGDYERVLSIVGEIFKDRNIPIAGGFPVGHSDLNLTVPLGVFAALDADTGSLSFPST